MTNKEIKALLEICQQYGVKRVKTADIELELDVVTPSTADVQNAPLVANSGPSEADLGQVYSAEQILNWSSGVDV